jgi:hypothetical protein
VGVIADEEAGKLDETVFGRYRLIELLGRL